MSNTAIPPASRSAQSQTLPVLSYDNGAATVTRHVVGQSSQYELQVNDPKIVQYLQQITSPTSLLAGLDPNKYLASTNSDVLTFTSPDSDHLHGQYLLDDPAMIPASTPNISRGPTADIEGYSSQISAGRGVPDGDVGRIQVTAGVYAHPEGNGYKLSFFRNANAALGIPGMYLGDWYFQGADAAKTLSGQ